MAIVIIHSRTKELITGTYCFEWSVHTFRRLINGELVSTKRLINKAKALEIIKSHGLVESHMTADGSVYDTPEGDFKSLFPGGLRTKNDIIEIEKTDRL